MLKIWRVVLQGRMIFITIVSKLNSVLTACLGKYFDHHLSLFHSTLTASTLELYHCQHFDCLSAHSPPICFCGFTAISPLCTSPRVHYENNAMPTNKRNMGKKVYRSFTTVSMVSPGVSFLSWNSLVVGIGELRHLQYLSFSRC